MGFGELVGALGNDRHSSFRAQAAGEISDVAVWSHLGVLGEGEIEGFLGTDAVTGEIPT